MCVSEGMSVKILLDPREMINGYLLGDTYTNNN